MKYVYILSTYEENGAENVVATLDREMVVQLAEKHFGYSDMGQLHGLLSRSDEDLSEDRSGHDFGKNWGGPMLHVVVLDSQPKR